MKRGTHTSHRAVEHGVDTAAVEIGVDGRRDAIRLMEALIPFSSFLVQSDREHWVVHARVPGCHGESLDDLLLAIQGCGAGSGVKEFTCFLDNKPVAPIRRRT